MELKRIRQKIDEIDLEILELLEKRMELGLRTKKFKKTVFDPGREASVLEKLKVRSRLSHLIRVNFVQLLFKEIMKESRELQEKERGLIGFQGEYGAFSEMAARYYDSRLLTIPFPHFGDIFEGVEKGHVDLGLVPVENTLGGAVNEVNELLMDCDLKVVGAIKLRIHHCLLALPGTRLEHIRVVYSHPQALSQCREYIKRHKLEVRPYYDTAGAARILAKEKSKTAAIIAHRLCRDLYNLKIVEDNIEDHECNYTRFFILAREEKASDQANKCSLIFSTPHQAGALFSILKIFADRGINLTRIESLPSRNEPGKYAFFLDFEKKDSKDDLASILEKVKSKTTMFKYLGLYKEEVYP